MKKWVIVSSVFFLGLGLIISGCAQKPTAELERAEKALQEAKDAGADKLAPADYTAAESKLEEGKKQIDAMKYSTAKGTLEEAERLAKIAKDKALSAKAPKPVTEPVKPEPTPVVKKETPPPKPEYVEYKVVKGDCLWEIAGKKDIYGDAYMWPLIYDANKDQIKDPDLIYPDQVFKVKKDVSQDEIDKARKKAGAPAKK